MPNELVTERVETLLLARLTTSQKALTVAALAKDTYRFAPTSFTTARWQEHVTECLRDLRARQLVDAPHRATRADELKRRAGAHTVRDWRTWVEHVLPALALGIRADNDKARKRLSGRDAWAAAIVARSYRIWTSGPPPTPPRLCDALTWRVLGLATPPKQCPAEVRAHFLHSYIDVTAAPDAMLRQLASQTVGAPRADRRALCVALIRTWLIGSEPGRHEAAPLASTAQSAPTLVEAVRSAARSAREGVFGDRKVFISSVWNALRTSPPWADLELDDFKARLVSAHRQRQLVLARADLVAAMDPALVAASETQTEGATFHFIVREPVQ